MRLQMINGGIEGRDLRNFNQNALPLWHWVTIRVPHVAHRHRDPGLDSDLVQLPLSAASAISRGDEQRGTLE